jgi:AraC-like DNA-binding protein
VPDPILDTATASPSAALRPFVGRFVGYAASGFEPGVHVGMPSRFLTFIVSFGRPVDIVAMPDPAQRPQKLHALVSGLASAPALIRHDGNEHGIQVEITPLGSRRLFRMPAAELASIVVRMDDVLGTLGNELVDRLEDATSWAARFAVLDDVLLRALCDAPADRPELVHAWRRLAASDGAISVASLARDVGYSRRHLTERFRSEFGLPPKLVGQILRFERARRLVVRSAGTSLARVAAECGYSDQAHMTRDFHRFAGASPTAWLRAEKLPFVQDDELVTP